MGCSKRGFVEYSVPLTTLCPSALSLRAVHETWIGVHTGSRLCVQHPPPVEDGPGICFEHDSVRCFLRLETYTQNQGQVCSKRRTIQSLFSAPHSLSGVLETCWVYASCCEPWSERGVRNVVLHSENNSFNTELKTYTSSRHCFQHPTL